MRWLPLAIAMLASVPQAANSPAPQAGEADLHKRLSVYEENAAANRANPEELAAIAAAVLKQVASSDNVDAIIQACSSQYAPRDVDCGAKLWRLAKRQDLGVAQRMAAANALLKRKDPAAAAFLFELAGSLAPMQLAGTVDLLKGLPAERAVPLLAPLLRSGDAATETAGCRGLAAFAGSASRDAVSSYLQTAPRGTGQWFACTIAAARMGDPEARRTTGFITSYLTGDDLLDAGDVLIATDRERGIGLYLQATRETRGMTRLDAADRLVDYQPQAAARLAGLALSSGDARVIAAALELHRHLKSEPSPQIRLLLIAADPLVQLRAAETILSWHGRRRGEAH